MLSGSLRCTIHPEKFFLRPNVPADARLSYWCHPQRLMSTLEVAVEKVKCDTGRGFCRTMARRISLTSRESISSPRGRPDARIAGGPVLRKASGDHHTRGTTQAADTEGKEVLQSISQQHTDYSHAPNQSISQRRSQSVQNVLKTYTLHTHRNHEGHIICRLVEQELWGWATFPYSTARSATEPISLIRSRT